jgi:catalase
MAQKTLTTKPGILVADNQNSLLNRRWGPILLPDVHLIKVRL